MVKLTKNPSGTRKLAESLAKKFLSMRKAQLSPEFIPHRIYSGAGARGMFTSHQKFGRGQVRPCEFLKRKEKAIVVGLIGELGSGKTTFLQGFAKGLGLKEKVLSPTFIIMRKFEIRNSKFENFYHIDCYRIEKPKEILDLGFKEVISNPQSIIAVEWADRIQKIMPKNTIWIRFNFLNKTTRKIKIQG